MTVQMQPFAAARPVDHIPLVDFSPALAGTPAGYRAVADQIADAATRVGFFFIVDHGVPQPLIDRVFALAAAFFARPLDEKMAISLAHSPHFRGYLPVGGFGASTERAGDLVEAFQMMPELALDDPDVLAGKPLHGPNLWPDAPADFKPTVLAYADALAGLAEKLLRAFAAGLDLPADMLLEKFRKPLSQLRLMHYPPQPPKSDSERRGVSPHTDTGAFTILAQDSNGGLEVQNLAGDWLPATPIPGSFVVNIGDSVMRWTNDRFRSTPHRVINRSGRDRFSLPYFVNADYDAVIECLPTCQGPDDPPRYPPLNQGPLVYEKFRRIWPSSAG